MNFSKREILNFGLLTFLSLFLVLSFNKVSSEKNNLKIPIWGFHDIVDRDRKEDWPPFRRKFETDYTKQDLRVFLEYLLENNYHFLSTTELENVFTSQKIKSPAVALTFDDGYLGIKTNLLPLLKDLHQKYRRKIKVVLFVSPDFFSRVDGDLQYLSCQDLKEGYDLGFYDIQSHGLSHFNLTKISAQEIENELKESKRLIIECLGSRKDIAKYFAYPYGNYNSETIKLVSKYYDLAFLYDNQVSFLEPDSKKYQISRYQAFKNISPEKLIKLSQEHTSIVPSKTEGI